MLTALLRTCFKDHIKTFPQGTNFNQQKMFLYPKYHRVEFSNDLSMAANIGAAYIFAVYITNRKSRLHRLRYLSMVI